MSHLVLMTVPWVILLSVVAPSLGCGGSVLIAVAVAITSLSGTAQASPLPVHAYILSLLLCISITTLTAVHCRHSGLFLCIVINAVVQLICSLNTSAAS